MQGALWGWRLPLGLPTPSSPPKPLREAPSWLRFPPCFSNYVEWAKNSSSGALFGSYHPVRGGLLIPSLQPLSGPLFVGRAPVVLTFVPTHSSSLGASGQCTPFPPPPRPSLLWASTTWVGGSRECPGPGASPPRVAGLCRGGFSVPHPDRGLSGRRAAATP